MTPDDTQPIPRYPADGYPEDFLAALQPGNALRTNYGPEAHPSKNTLHHVRAIVDGFMIVTRRWRDPARGWEYTVEHRASLYVLWKAGVLSLASTGGSHE